MCSLMFAWIVLLSFVQFDCLLSQTNPISCNEAWDPDCSPSKSVVVEPEWGACNCNGYFSCYKASDIRASNHYETRCYGSCSCYNSNRVRYLSSVSYESLYCSGLFSCSDVNTLYNNYGPIFCYGEQSCADSTITVWYSKWLRAYGARSVMNSITKVDQRYTVYIYIYTVYASYFFFFV